VVKPRVIETTEGIQGEFDVVAYDRMMRRMRDRGWIETSEILKAGITDGVALEIGPGPGYLGLDWLSKTEETRLVGLEISANMIAMAQRNAQEAGLSERVNYVHGDACKMPFEDETFDAVFTNGSLHEWAEPLAIFNEIARVLKPGGRYCISDLRRDMNPLLKGLMWAFTRPKLMRAGLISSINAAYIEQELRELVAGSELARPEIKKNVIGLAVIGEKEDAQRNAGKAA
jgi:ubiquinone/menaquinone biosynthesis C-methylase UbiE